MVYCLVEWKVEYLDNEMVEHLVGHWASWLAGRMESEMDYNWAGLTVVSTAGWRADSLAGWKAVWRVVNLVGSSVGWSGFRKVGSSVGSWEFRKVGQSAVKLEILKVGQMADLSDSWMVAQRVYEMGKPTAVSWAGC